MGITVTVVCCLFTPDTPKLLLSEFLFMLIQLSFVSHFLYICLAKLPTLFSLSQISQNPHKMRRQMDFISQEDTLFSTCIIGSS